MPQEVVVYLGLLPVNVIAALHSCVLRLQVHTIAYVDVAHIRLPWHVC